MTLSIFYYDIPIYTWDTVKFATLYAFQTVKFVIRLRDPSQYFRNVLRCLSYIKLNFQRTRCTTIHQKKINNTIRHFRLFIVCFWGLKSQLRYRSFEKNWNNGVWSLNVKGDLCTCCSAYLVLYIQVAAKVHACWNCGCKWKGLVPFYFLRCLSVFFFGI